MTSLGDEIGEYLGGQGIGLNFSSGTVNCFSSQLPDKPDLAAAVIERGGLRPVMWLTGPARTNESHVDQPVVQIFVRSSMTGYNVGNTLAENIFGALQGFCEGALNLGGAWFHLISAIQSPMYLGRDNKERHQWSQNFHVIWENTQR